MNNSTAYTCYHGDRDVKLPIYVNGEAITVSDCIDRLRELEVLERKSAHGCIDANCDECDPCPCCGGEGGTMVDFEHPQWVPCGCR